MPKLWFVMASSPCSSHISLPCSTCRPQIYFYTPQKSWNSLSFSITWCQFTSNENVFLLSRCPDCQTSLLSSSVHTIKADLAFILLFLSAEPGPVPAGRTETEEYPGSQICTSSPCFYPQRSELLQWSQNCSTRLFFPSSWVGFHTIKKSQPK